MAGRRSRNKGKRGEREIINALQPVVDRVCAEVGADAVVLERNLLQAHSGGCDVYGLEWLSMEVKRQENGSGLGSWWRQTLQQARADQTPVLVWRANRQPWRVRMRVPVRVGSGAGAKLVTMTVDVDWDSFLVYFETRVRYELTKGV